MDPPIRPEFEAPGKPLPPQPELPEILEAHPTASRLPYTAWDIMLALIGVGGAVLVSGVATLTAAWAASHLGENSWIATLLGGAVSTIAGGVGGVLMLRWFYKFRHNHSDSGWKTTHGPPSIVGLGLLAAVAMLAEPALLIVALGVAALGGGAALMLFDTFPFALAATLAWLGLPAAAAAAALVFGTNMRELV